eukprot:gene12480-biopygen12482
MHHTIGEEICRNAAPQAPREWNGPNRAAAAVAATAHAGATALAEVRARWRERTHQATTALSLCAIPWRQRCSAAPGSRPPVHAAAGTA